MSTELSIEKAVVFCGGVSYAAVNIELSAKCQSKTAVCREAVKMNESDGV